MLAILPLVFALQLSSGHDAAARRTALRIDHGAASVTRSSLGASPTFGIAAALQAAPSPRLALGSPHPADGEASPLPAYQPAPEEWIAHFAGRLDLSDASVTHAARWVAAFPLKVYVGSGAVSMRLTLRTP